MHLDPLRSVRRAAGAALFLGTAGCHGCSCNPEGYRYVRTETADYAFHDPVDAVMREVDAVIASEGYHLPPPPYSETSDIESSVKHDLAGDTRYAVRIYRIDASRFTLTLRLRQDTKVGAGTLTTYSSNAWRELAIIERIDAPAASAMRDEARRRGPLLDFTR